MLSTLHTHKEAIAVAGVFILLAAFVIVYGLMAWAMNGVAREEDRACGRRRTAQAAERHARTVAMVNAQRASGRRPRARI